MRTSLIVILTSILLITTSCKEKQTQMTLPPPNIPVVEVITRDVMGFREFPVNIEGKINNDVRAKISGYIQEVYVDEGQPVSKGQALFRLETNVQSQDADAARSAIIAAEANIVAANAAVNAAQVEVNKLIPLVERNVISNVQLETARANLMRAQGQQEQAKAAKRQAEAGLGAVTASMDFAVVRSPVSGVVGIINHRQGSLVGPSDPTPITTVSETNQVYAYFSMNEGEYLNFLEEFEGNSVKEKLNSLPEVELILANGKPYSEKGKIQTVTGQIAPSTGTIQFRATFNNPQRILSNGNSGFLRIPHEYKDALVIPENATYEQQGNIFVYKVANDTVYATKVELTNRVNNMAIIQSGINKGDVVAAKGLMQLRNKTAITPQKTNLDSIVNTVQQIM
ncbi:MAG: efflux RND transporter periplasmic adaptor subunit [Weeksellaceae bacterium]